MKYFDTYTSSTFAKVIGYVGSSSQGSYKATINGEFNGIGINNETGTLILGWRVFLKTTDNCYTTSAKQHPMMALIESVESSSSGANMGEIYTVRIYEQKNVNVDINTDITDEKTLVSGVVEVPYVSSGLRLRIRAEWDFTDGTFVDVPNSVGKPLTTGSFEIGTPINEDFTDYAPRGGASFVSMDNFNDEENPTLKYTSAITNNIFSISFDGTTELVSKTLTKYSASGEREQVISFTEDERKLIRQALKDAPYQEAYMYLTTTNSSNSLKNRNGIRRTISIINGEPVFSPTIKDTNATTIALTGNANTLVRYHSNANVVSNVALQKEAGSIVSHKITLGSKSTNAYSTTFNAVESNKYVFTATDSRGFNTTKEVEPPFIDYVKLTCAVDNEPIGTISGTMKITIHGNYYNGSFGASSNNLGLSYRFKLKSAEWGNWVNVSNPSIYGNSYSVDITLSGLDYQNTYEIQAMATDRLNTITTVIYTITTVPTFDWSRNDFNFNVPVNFSDTANFTKSINVEGATTLESTTTINGAATLNSTATIKGTTNLNGTVNFNSSNINFNQGLNLNTTTTTFDNNPIADYIVETGTAAMGTNGTWKWQKWASGKAECWGRRNYGNTGFGTALIANPYLFISSTFNQDLPDIFNAEPDVVDINVIKSNDGNITYMWVVRNGSATASTTGDFALVKSTATTVQQLNLGFHIVGTWK